MSDEDISTEKVILEAAKKVFLDKGFDGARMQQIADEAGINKALLHYYFRSKDKLFDAIFEDAFMQFLPNISQIMVSDMEFSEKIRAFVGHYIDMLLNNPHLPIFIMRELQRNPEKIIEMMKKVGINPGSLASYLQKETEEGGVATIPMVHLIVNMIGLCVFPFIGRPIIEGFIFNNNTEAYNKFLVERKTMVADFVINAIQIK
ncbi:MAG: TetR/AcrR family transcriptional regulator [Bacteroidota bacterium]